MTDLIMFDTDEDGEFPRGAQAYAAYVVGQAGSQPNYSWIVAEFPNAHHLSITLSASEDAGTLDVENGAATVADVPGWYDRQRAGGAGRPCLYANASTMQAGIIPLVRSGRIPRASVRLWSAHYAGQHICAPSSCGAVSIAMDGTQWTSSAWGRNLDESLLLADFFGTPAPPAPPADWQAVLMNKLPVLQDGSTDMPGEVFFVHRAQALVKVYGEITGLADAACQEFTGTFDAVTRVAVQQVQAHAGLATDGVVGPRTWGVLVAGSAS